MSHAVSPPSDVYIKCISCGVDDVGPSVSLAVVGTLNGLRSRGEYVFGVGEGLSRAVLEHKSRPGSNLRAMFCSTLASSQMGGLGGLVLRLRADGHKQVRG
jgi:hypothetical protein